MKLNSWAPMEIVNDRATKSTSQPRTTSLTTPPKSKLTTSSYAEKYHAMSIQKANQATERHVPKAAENTPGSSYAEMHRAKAKKDKSKVVNPGVNLNQTAPAGTVNSYALLYKRGTISSKAKASNSAEPAIGDHTPKESIPRGAQSHLLLHVPFKVPFHRVMKNPSSHHRENLFQCHCPAHGLTGLN